VPYWVVDPICGTRNVTSGIPLFAINAALVEDGRVAVSVVGDGPTGDVQVLELLRADGP
jgi:myo-inositol-1(or 4)-monophosphatase